MIGFTLFRDGRKDKSTKTSLPHQTSDACAEIAVSNENFQTFMNTSGEKR